MPHLPAAPRPAIGPAYMHPATSAALLAESRRRTAALRREREARAARAALFAHLPTLASER